jgi:creatinine amidohydrolase
MRLEDMNWMDVERYLEKDNRIMLITGATEKHAYLSLMTDILIPSKLAQAVSEKEGILIAPPLNFGHSRVFANFPGTISLTPQTFSRVLVEIIECLLHQGFRRFFILNGHGGNPVPDMLQDFIEADEEILVIWYNWWKEDAVKEFEAKHDLRVNHANWGENFPFNRLGASPSPDGIKPTVNGDDIGEFGETARDVLGDGSFGGSYQVDDALTQELFNSVVDEITALVRDMAL